MTPIIHKKTNVIAPAAIVHSNPVVESKTRRVYFATSVLSSCTSTFVIMLNTNNINEKMGLRTTLTSLVFDFMFTIFCFKT